MLHVNLSAEKPVLTADSAGGTGNRGTSRGAARHSLVARSRSRSRRGVAEEQAFTTPAASAAKAQRLTPPMQRDLGRATHSTKLDM